MKVLDIFQDKIDMSQKNNPTRIKGRRGSKNSVSSESSISSCKTNSMDIIKETASDLLDEKEIVITDNYDSNKENKKIDEKSDNTSEELKENAENGLELNGNSTEVENKSDSEKESDEKKNDENGFQISETEKNGNDSNCEKSLSSQEAMEPLVLDGEETELELSLNSSESESDNVNRSPVLSRCATRRSQNRYVPTPKTPKVVNGDMTFEENPATYDEKIMKRVTVDLEILKEDKLKLVTGQENTSSFNSSFHSVEDENDVSEIKTEDESVTEASIDNEQDEEGASMIANYTGNDMTRNVDLTFRDSLTSTPDIVDDDSLSFVNLTKDLSYSGSLRAIGRRKTVQDLRQESFRNSYKVYEENKKPLVPFFGNIFSRRDSTPSESSISVGVKRKIDRSLTPEDTGKKIKIEHGSSLFSYVSSPIDKIKKKLSATSQVPSNMPKTSTYKPGINLHSSSISESVNFNEMGKNGNEGSESYKRWCNIQ